MTWKQPEFFFFIPFVLALFLFVVFKGRKKSALKWSSLSYGWGEIPPSLRVLFWWMPYLLQALSMMCLIAALARPQESNQGAGRTTEGADIMIAFDISFSMMVEDMNPGTRLDSAKKVIHTFIDHLSSDRVGLILFSGESYTKVPLTLDSVLLKQTVASIETSSVIEQGTAIGVALANAVSRLRHSESKSKVIILITDGENNTGSIHPETATAIAKSYGIKIYSIGIGSEGAAKVPIKQKDAYGKERTFFARIESKINKKLLSSIAHETAGRFYLAQDLEGFKEIFSEIENLEKTKIKTKKWLQMDEKFQDWLEPSFFLYLASLVLSFTVWGRVV